jgi:branched-chain amino acid transport system substrate-binding protein
VLPPGSNFVPMLADDVLAALEFGLAESGLAAELVTEFAGCNADMKIVGPKVQQLMVAGRVACIVAPLSVSLIEKLAPQFDGRACPLVALHLGEDPIFETARHHSVFVNNYRLWRAAWMCGYLGVTRFGRRAAVLTAFHEGGYALPFAVQLGMETAGGELVHTSVTHRDSRTEDPSAAIAAAAATAPDFICAAYSGQEAVSFLTAYEASGCKGRIPVLGLSPLVEEHVRAGAGAAVLGTHVVTPGPRAADAHPMTAALAAALGRPPHPYALLAYESAHLIAAAFAAAAVTGASGSGLAQALRDARFDGPRGPARFDDGTESPAPLCVRTVGVGEDAVE